MNKTHKTLTDLEKKKTDFLIPTLVIRKKNMCKVYPGE